MVRASRPIAAALVVWAVLAVACPRKRSLEEALGAALAAADVAWRDRDANGFAPVASALDEAEALVPNHPEVGWRRVRLAIAEGLAADDPVVGVRAFARAREAGIRCVLGPDQVVGVDLGVVLRAVSEAQAPCVAWTTLAWARWFLAFGPVAAAIDLERIDTLLAWSAAREPLQGPHENVAAWADGIVSAARPATSGRDLVRAEQRLRSVTESQPDDAVILLDLLVLVVEPQGETAAAAELGASLHQVELDTPEERGAIGRWRTSSVTAP